MTEIFATGIQMGESRAGTPASSWMCDWLAGEVLALDAGGNREVVASVEGLPFSIDWLPDRSPLLECGFDPPIGCFCGRYRTVAGGRRSPHRSAELDCRDLLRRISTKRSAFGIRCARDAWTAYCPKGRASARQAGSIVYSYAAPLPKVSGCQSPSIDVTTGQINDASAAWPRTLRWFQSLEKFSNLSW